MTTAMAGATHSTPVTFTQARFILERVYGLTPAAGFAVLTAAQLDSHADWWQSSDHRVSVRYVSTWTRNRARKIGRFTVRYAPNAQPLAVPALTGRVGARERCNAAPSILTPEQCSALGVRRTS